jgi:hypothetical protein
VNIAAACRVTDTYRVDKQTNSLEELTVIEEIKYFPPLMNVKFHYLFHKSRSVIAVLGQIKLAQVHNISRSILILSRHVEFTFPN